MTIQKYLGGSLDVLFGPRRRLGSLEKNVLEHLSSGDLLVSFLCSGRSTKALYRDAYQRAKARYAMKQAIARLKRDGLVRQVAEAGDTLSITSMGRAAVSREVGILRKVKKSNRRWDGKWRIVSFDIPQKYSTTRNALRRLLLRADFKQVQKSVYIHPYPCDALVKLLREDRQLARYTFFCMTDMVTTRDLWMRKCGLR